MDFSWPVYYHLTIKNQLPNVVIPGKRVRIDFSLVNELDMFRGDDILAECPIPLRVIAVPLEDPNAELGPDGKPKKHEIDAEILTRHVRVKPVIAKNGTGTAIVTINASPVLRGNDQIPFLLQFTVSPKSRIFNYIVPASTKPMLICSPDSDAAKKMFEEEMYDEWDDEDDEDYEDEDEDGEEFEEDEDEEDVATRSKFAKSTWGVGGDDEDDEDIEGYFVDDDDFEEDEDEDYEYDDDEDDEMGAISDDDLYEKPLGAKEEEHDHDHDHDHDHGAEPQIPGVYHAFVADSLARCRPAPSLANALSAANTAPVPAAPVGRPVGGARPSIPMARAAPSTGASGGLQVQGMQYRRPKALPPALQKKKDEEAQAQAQAQTIQTTQASEAGKTGIITGFRPEGQAEALLNANSGVSLLDPLNGVFTVNTHLCASTLSARQSLQQVAYAYIKVIQGTSIGARIWDGALYLMRFLTRLTQQSQTWLDGLRVLELGAGTGILGIWLYQLMYQRAQAQLLFAMSHVPADMKVEVESAVRALSAGDFRYASQHLNGTNDYVNSAFTISKRALEVAKALISYAKPPLMAVTDQGSVYELMSGNVSMNVGPRMDHWKQSARADAVTVTVEGERAVIQCDDPDTTRKIRPVTPASGLHVFELDWSQPLSKSILKMCGVTMVPGDKDAVVRPEQDAICAEEKFAALRAHISAIYSQYRSLKRASATTGKDALVTEHYLLDERRRPAFELNTMPGIDVVVASECLYNDRYFSVLVDTINSLYTAHEYAHAQHMDAYNHAVAKYKKWAEENDVLVDATHIPAAPVKTLPLVLLSYRLRATHEEDTINDTFFKVLEATGKYHTAIPLSRVLKMKEEAVSSRPTHDQVHERALLRKERESEIRNALLDLDVDRQEQTRLAVLYQCPGKDAAGNVESPVGNLTPNAAFLFKLFQAL